jgi:signal transduction histidine kinase
MQAIWRSAGTAALDHRDLIEVWLSHGNEVPMTEEYHGEQYPGAVKNDLEQLVAERTHELHATIQALEDEITERKRKSDALSYSRERLKRLSRKTLDVLEADRCNVSKELHDGIGAGLAAIKFSLEGKEINRARNHGTLNESLDQEITYLSAMIKESKRISANLRPTTLDDLGLLATIQWHLRQFQRLHGDLRIDFTSEINEGDVPEAMKIIFYRIIQEGLDNAEKRSEAKSVRLHMAFSEGRHSICLTIEVDGRGFNVEEAYSEKDPLSGSGLIAIRERCEIFGGSFHVEPRISAGTKITAILPI